MKREWMKVRHQVIKYKYPKVTIRLSFSKNALYISGAWYKKKPIKIYLKGGK